MKRFIALLLLALITLLMGLMFTGCGSRKTATNKTEEKTSQKDTLSQTITTSEQSAEKTKTKQELQQKEEQKEIAVKVKNDEKVQIDQYDANGKLIGSTVVKGSGEATIKQSNKNTNAKKEVSTSTGKKTTIDFTKNASAVTETKKSAEAKETERKESFQNYLYIAFVASLIFLLWKHRKKEDA